MTKIRIAHSPDADDAFMFTPLFQGKVGQGVFMNQPRSGVEGALPAPMIIIEEVREDIETLNRLSKEGTYEVTAISFHAFPYIADKYLLLSTGACFGENYGPIIVASKPLKAKQLLKVRMGIPGKMTSAFLALKLYEQYLAGEGHSGICYSEIPFDQIMEQVASGKLDAGLIIHEGQLNYAEKGLHKIVDLGEWWHKETHLPLPLGGIVIRRDLDPEVIKQVAGLIQSSIRFSLDHKEDSVKEALPFARGLDPERATRFIDMYVNEKTIDMGKEGFKAVKLLLDKGYQASILLKEVDLDEAYYNLKKGKIPSSSAEISESKKEEPSIQLSVSEPVEKPLL